MTNKQATQGPVGTEGIGDGMAPTRARFVCVTFTPDGEINSIELEGVGSGTIAAAAGVLGDLAMGLRAPLVIKSLQRIEAREFKIARPGAPFS